MAEGVPGDATPEEIDEKLLWEFRQLGANGGTVSAFAGLAIGAAGSFNSVVVSNGGRLIINGTTSIGIDSPGRCSSIAAPN